jgi:Ni,Fe-hydrogenase III large subunit
MALGTVGPVARGSGVDFDIRKILPYAAYGKIPFSSIVETEGDVEARVKVRLKEILESIKIVSHTFNNIPQGPISMEPLVMKEGYTSSRTEAPRGELLHFIKLSERGVIENFHLRTPTKANANALKHIAKEENIEDFMLLVTSLDPCIACFDSAIIKG